MRPTFFQYFRVNISVNNAASQKALRFYNRGGAQRERERESGHQERERGGAPREREREGGRERERERKREREREIGGTPRERGGAPRGRGRGGAPRKGERGTEWTAAIKCFDPTPPCKSRNCRDRYRRPSGPKGWAWIECCRMA